MMTQSDDMVCTCLASSVSVCDSWRKSAVRWTMRSCSCPPIETYTQPAQYLGREGDSAVSCSREPITKGVRLASQLASQPASSALAVGSPSLPFWTRRKKLCLSLGKARSTAGRQARKQRCMYPFTHSLVRPVGELVSWLADKSKKAFVTITSAPHHLPPFPFR